MCSTQRITCNKKVCRVGSTSRLFISLLTIFTMKFIKYFPAKYRAIAPISAGANFIRLVIHSLIRASKSAAENSFIVKSNYL